MLRASCFVLALVVGTFALSTAHAAPPSITPFAEWFTGWKLKNFTKLHRKTPLGLGILGEVDELPLGHILGWPFSFVGGLQLCKHSIWFCDDKNSKNDDRAKAY
jgi:hypothetical protein